jgi:hypothetical protein
VILKNSQDFIEKELKTGLNLFILYFMEEAAHLNTRYVKLSDMAPLK